MVNKITKRAILKIRETVDAYGKEMAAMSEKIATIDEKYRKLAEKETEELKVAYASLKAEQEIWSFSLSRYDADAVNEVLGESLGGSQTSGGAPEQAAGHDSAAGEGEEAVVDTLFGENNVPTGDEAGEPAAEGFPVGDDMPEGAFEERTAEAPKEEVRAEFPEDDADGAAEESDISTDDGWPEFPEEWNN